MSATMNFPMRINLIVILLLLISCKKDIEEIATLQGWWQQEGYGNVYEIKEDEILAYNTTSIGCSSAGALPTEIFSKNYRVTSDSLFLKDGINQYRFKRINPTNHICADVDESKLTDPRYNFDFLWETFNENYCYFNERNIDWQSLKLKYRSQLTAESSDLELYKVLRSMTDEIGDGHVGLSAGDEVEEAYEEEMEAQEDDGEDGPGTIALLAIAKDLALANADNIKSYNKGIVNHGSIADSILYLQVNSMMVMADYGISDTLDQIPFLQTYFGIMEERPDHNENEMVGIKNLMETIVSENQYKACVLDIRFNGGGKDEVALEIMSYLTGQPYSIGNKKALYRNKWLRSVQINQHQAKNALDIPLVVLTSHETASAAEIMTMSVLAHPNATLIGSATAGIFSDMLDKVLPNGWEVSLSNEVYLDHKGINHEAKGISPDIVMDYDKTGMRFLETLQSQPGLKDKAIDQAIEILSQTR